jgi:hypothetical protein
MVLDDRLRDRGGVGVRPEPGGDRAQPVGGDAARGEEERVDLRRARALRRVDLVLRDARLVERQRALRGERGDQPALRGPGDQRVQRRLERRLALRSLAAEEAGREQVVVVDHRRVRSPLLEGNEAINDTRPFRETLAATFSFDP